MGSGRRRVVWSQTASSELDDAIGYVAEDSIQSAVRLLERLLGAAESLSELEERGRIVPELEDPSIRELQVEPYRLIYSVSASAVVVLSILHQRRDFEGFESRL